MTSGSDEMMRKKILDEYARLGASAPVTRMLYKALMQTETILKDLGPRVVVQEEP